MIEWAVICRPEGLNPMSTASSKNRGGLIVIITNGEEEHEVSRVAFVRRNSRNPDVSFVEQLQIELDKAEEVAQTINELDEALVEAQRDAVRRASEQVRAIIGKLDRVPA